MNIPEPGFYYHYKHDESKGVTDCAYEVTGLVRHSEDDSLLASYVPLYKNDFLAPAQQCVRPVEMFFEEVTYGGKVVPRFQEITDPQIIATLIATKASLAA